MTWGPTLTTEQEELLNDQVDEALPSKIAGLTLSRDTLVNDIIPKLEDIKELHKVFYDWFNAVATYYDEELRWYDGNYISSPVTDTDLEDAINRVSSARFYPDGWLDFEPKYLDELKGITDASSYENEACMHEVAAGLAASLNAGLNGTATDTTTAIVTQAATVDVQIAGLSSNFTIGADAYVIDSSGFNRFVGRITNTLTTPERVRINVTAWCGGSIAVGSTISDAPTPKSNGLNDSRDKLVTYITNQRTALQNNDDNISYTGVDTDIDNAITNATDTINNYNSSWTFAQMVTYLANRKTFMTGTRLGQIGQAVDTPDDGIYDRRYDWINYLINRKIGSWEKLVRNEEAVDYLNEDISTLTDQKDDLEEWRDG